MRSKLLLLSGVVLTFAGCRGSDAGTGATGGTLIIASGADAITLLPPASPPLIMDRQVEELVYDYLARIGDDMKADGDKGFTPRLADSWTWAPDSMSIAFHIDPKARWHDGVPVTASDVRFTYAAYKDPSAQASIEIADIDSVTLKDSATAVFWFNKRTLNQFYDAASQMLIIPEHVLKGTAMNKLASATAASAPVGSGQFRFSKWDRGSSLELLADTANYKGRPKLDRLVWTISRDFAPLVTRLFAGEADLIDVLRPEIVNGLKGHPDFRLVSFPSMDYGLMLFNLRDPNDPKKAHPILGDVAMRRALSMAVDRPTLVKSVLDTLALPALGPTVRAYPGADTTFAVPPYDTVAAKHLLDSLGWKSNASTGVREKNGRKLAFTLLTPTSSATRSGAAVLLQEQLKRVGVEVNIEQLDNAAMQGRVLGQRKFDAAMMAWHVDPTYKGMHSVYGTGGEINTGSYSNPKFDAQLDSTLSATTLEKAQPHLHSALETLVADAPGIWLYELKGGITLHKRVMPAHIRPDSWWSNLADWTIPAGERIDRDKIGLGAAKQ